MGKLLDQFAGLKFNNEAEVSQDFILPLLQNYLGYSLNEIKPEEHYPARDLHSGVNTEKGGSKGLTHRPDFVICLDGNIDEPRFIIDSKAPSENINDHFGQLRSYANSVGRNFLMMTNGTEIKVFDVNVLLFYSDSIESLQNKLDHLVGLLGRDNQALKSHFEILSNLNYAGSIGITQEDEFNMQVNKNMLILSDFRIYLQNIRDQFTNWHLPINNFQAINNLEIQKINPHHHLTFKHYLAVKERYDRENSIKLTQIQREYNLNIKVFVGNTGAGKTTLLRYLTYFNAQNCLDFRDVNIPVYIPLREIGHNYNLEFLIERQLNNGGYTCSSFRDLAGKNKFVFLLDAYDEISEGLRLETFQAIENLSQKHECFVTTRPNIVPQFTPSEIFEILPISEEQIEEITRAYIDNGYYDFQSKVESNNLKAEAGNTLLLLFLISIFKETGSLPSTATKIINDIVTRVKKWQEAKAKQFGHLNWATLAEFLSAIAYRIAEAGDANLSIDDAEEVILEIQLEMEAKRKIPANLTVGDIVNHLKQTGLIISTDDQIYFWHRLFLDYFAAFGLKRDFQKDHNVIHRLVNQQKWEMILVGLSSLLADSSNLISMVKGEIWLAAYCLSENMNCSSAITKEIVDGLINQLGSPVQSLRKRAMSYLARIGNEQANEFLYTVFDQDYPADVKMIALSNIAKHKTPAAKKIIYDHIDWNEGDFFKGTSSQAHVLYGLSCFDEPEHLRIIENWEKYHDYMANMTCERIFLELHAKNQLSKTVIGKLKEFFMRNFQLHKQGGEKVNALGKILSKFQDENFALQVLELAYIHADISKQDSVYMLLKSINSIKVINSVKEKIFKQPEPYYIAENFAKAICHSVCDIPKEIFIELIEHPNKNIGSIALQTLTRFSFNDVKEVVSKHLDGKNGQLQSAALKVAVENAEIISLIRNNTLPELLYLPTIHTLLDAIRRYNLTEAKSTLKNISKWISRKKRYVQEYSLAFHLAKTCYYIGEKEIHDAVVKLYFNGSAFLQNDEHLHNNLMKSLKEMERGVAIEIAKCYYRKHFPAPEDKFNYETEVFIETTEELQYAELNIYLKEIAEDMIVEVKKENETAIHRLERPLSALVLLGTSSDEEWIINHLDDFKIQSRPDQAQLRRALECLAQFGSIKALSSIRTIAQEYSNDDSLVNVSQVAYEAICYRENLSVPENALFEFN